MLRTFTLATILWLAGGTPVAAQVFGPQFSNDPQLAKMVLVLENMKQVLFQTNPHQLVGRDYAILGLTTAQNRLLVALGMPPEAQPMMSVNGGNKAISEQELRGAILLLSNCIAYLQTTQPGLQQALAARDLQAVLVPLQRSLQVAQQRRLGRPVR